MAQETVKYPNWDGLSDNVQRVSLQDDIAPNSQDWDQIVLEVLQHQTIISGLTALPDTSELTENTAYYLTINNGTLAWTSA